jgi:hypothetical protein
VLDQAESGPDMCRTGESEKVRDGFFQAFKKTLPFMWIAEFC